MECDLACVASNKLNEKEITQKRSEREREIENTHSILSSNATIGYLFIMYAMGRYHPCGLYK